MTRLICSECLLFVFCCFSLCWLCLRAVFVVLWCVQQHCTINNSDNGINIHFIANNTNTFAFCACFAAKVCSSLCLHTRTHNAHRSAVETSSCVETSVSKPDLPLYRVLLEVPPYVSLDQIEKRTLTTVVRVHSCCRCSLLHVLFRNDFVWGVDAREATLDEEIEFYMNLWTSGCALNYVLQRMIG